MQISDILTPYFTKMGLRYLSGNMNSVEPLLIFVLHDLIYQIFEEEIKNKPFRHELRKIQKEWDNLNDSHFKSFFREMDREREDIIIDYMDDFESFVGNELTLIKCKIMDCFSFMSFEEQKFRAALETCNLLAQIASIHWAALVKRPSGNLSKNPYDARILYLTEKMSHILYGRDSENMIEKKKFNELVSFVTLFERKMVDYINLKSKNDKENEKEVAS